MTLFERHCNEIQNSIQFFVNNPNRVIEFGENGRNFVIENFDEKILWNHFIKVLKDE